MAKSPFPNEVNQDYGFDDNQDAGFDDMQASPEGFEGAAAGPALKLLITVRLGKAGYEAAVLNRPDVKKKTSKVSLEQAGMELVKSMNLAWDDFKDVSSYRDRDTGKRQYEYQGEPF
jgi:hypothetical protein